MYICYIDESGTSDIPGNTSHFVLAGISIPEWQWKSCDREIETIKDKYCAGGTEIHVGWMLRPYREQHNITDFEKLSYQQRKAQVISLRKAEIFRLQRINNPQLLKQTKKNFIKTEAYIHLTFDERKNFVLDLAECIASWSFARLFAECINKIFFDPSRATHTLDEQAFEQLVSRFEHYLQNISRGSGPNHLGILVHDNNSTIEKKHTELMNKFHQKGTLWTQVNNIIETPLFVDSQLTSMVQIADVCAYALRRYLENREETLFDHVFQRADRKDNVVVGVRHFSNNACKCKICEAHKRKSCTTIE
jgi:hypothetical protein